MLLGLLAAVVLAVLLQLNAGRARRAPAYDFAADGTIRLRCWVIVEAPAAVAARSATVLALPAPAPRAAPLKFVGEMRMLKRPRASRSLVAIPPDAIVIPGDVLPALVAAERISASIWQSPPGRSPTPGVGLTLH